jgi:Na+/H+ antiporter NhaD/arsenite permease-like protein
VTLFFLEAFIKDWVHLPLSWIAVIGAMSLMILADIENIEYLLHKVLFFSSPPILPSFSTSIFNAMCVGGVGYINVFRGFVRFVGRT